MHFYTKSAVALALAVLFVTPLTSFALTDSQIGAVTGLLRSFGADDNSVQNVYISLHGGEVLGVSTGAFCPRLTKTVIRGSRDRAGDTSVRELQTFLAEYYGVNKDDVVTGYFGLLTQRYVVQFQKEVGLPSVGIVGSLTSTQIANRCGTGTLTPVGVSTVPPLITPPIAACPAIGWIIPIAPCSGTWKPTYSTTGCQSGWQCVTSTATTTPPATPSLSVYPPVGAAPLSVTFTGDTGSGCSGGNFTLNFGDGQSEIVAIPADKCNGTFTTAHTYTAAGSYIASLGSKGGTRTVEVTVTPGTATSAISLKSYPIVTNESSSLSANGLADGRLMRFSVRANSTGNIALTQLFLTISPSGFDSGGGVSNVNVYAYEDGSYSSPISGVSSSGALRATDGCPSGCSFGELVNVGIQNAFGALSTIQIPAGATRYFEVRGVVTGATSNTPVTTRLVGDGVFSGPASATSFVGKDAYFIWSPNATTTASRASTDWYTGGGVPGLPSSGLLLTRTGSGGVTATTTPPVLPTPVINSFAASPSSIMSGDAAVLSWSASNTTDGGCYVRDAAGSTITPNSLWSGSGTFSVSPTVTTTYKLWCTSSWKDGSPTAEQTLTVKVTPQPTPLPPSGDAAVVTWKPYTFSTLGTPPCSGNRYVGYSAKYDKWVGAVLCGTTTKYKLYMSASETGTYYQVADYAGHGQDQCELVNPSFTLPNEDDIRSGSCTNCSVGGLVDVKNEQVYARARFGEVFNFVTSVFWSDLTTNSYSCGVSIGSFNFEKPKNSWGGGTNLY